MAERWRKTEKMIAALDAYKAEFPMLRPEWTKYIDYGHPPPEEEALARQFAQEIYELGEQITELQDRYRAIREWQYRYAQRYPMASIPVYEPKKERKPKITRPPTFPSGTFYMDEVPNGEVVLTQKELSKGNYTIENDSVEVTTLGKTDPVYLTGPGTLKLDGKPIGTVTGIKQAVAGDMEVTAQITDMGVYNALTSGVGEAWSFKDWAFKKKSG